MRILMLVATTVHTDTRVLRESTTLVGAGHDVFVIGRSVPPDYVPPEGVTVASVDTSSIFRPGAGRSTPSKRMPAPARLARWALLPAHRSSAFGRWSQEAVSVALAHEFDVVHAHDYTALAAGAELAARRGVPLIYDSHEFWPGRPREHRPTPIASWRERRRERDLGNRAHTVITVGAGVADALQSAYGWPNVRVVRNTFPARHPGLTVASPPSALVYAGRLAADRELETIASASLRIDLPVVLRGPADPVWLQNFDPQKTQVKEPLPLDMVDDELASAGAALVTHSDRWANHRLALPNKLFHSVRIGVPVVATDVGEMGALVRAYQLGPLYKPGDPNSLVRAIDDLVTNHAKYLANVREAQSDLSWDHDAQTLLDIYEDVARRRHESP